MLGISRTAGIGCAGGNAVHNAYRGKDTAVAWVRIKYRT